MKKETGIKNKIKIYRAINSMTQEELSRAAGISRITICNIENQNVIPNGNTMLKIAKGLNAPVGDIFSGDCITCNTECKV